MFAYLPALLLVLDPQLAIGDSALAFGKSEFGHHVTIEKRADHLLVHTNIHVPALEQKRQRENGRLKVTLVTSAGDEVVREVRIAEPPETWSLYFEVPLHDAADELRLGLVARITGSRGSVATVCSVHDDHVDLGTREKPITLEYDVEASIATEVRPGQFAVNVVHEKRLIRNDYDNLPIVALSSLRSRLPEAIDDDQLATRIDSK